MFDFGALISLILSILGIGQGGWLSTLFGGLGWA